jgi:hypothetical protein
MTITHWLPIATFSFLLGCGGATRSEVAVVDDAGIDGIAVGAGEGDSGEGNSTLDAGSETVSEVAVDSSLAVDAPADSAVPDAAGLLILDSGVDSCPTDLKHGFIVGTELCAALPKPIDSEVGQLCLPASGDGRPVGASACPYLDNNITSLTLLCRAWTSADGPNILLTPDHIPMGASVCSWLGFHSATPTLCCTGLVGELPGGSNLLEAGYVVFGRVVDTDGDSVPDIIDNCPSDQNLSQGDVDRDGVGDVCDDCPYTYNPDQVSMVDGGIGNACNCALTPQPVLGRNGCPCADAGESGLTDGGDRCNLLIAADGGVSHL